jgi:hypothetical protein
MILSKETKSIFRMVGIFEGCMNRIRTEIENNDPMSKSDVFVVI